MSSERETPAARPWNLLVPGSPDQRTGGYEYVRQIARTLRELGQPVELQGLAGHFPLADDMAREAMNSALRSLPDGAVVILDGLAMGGLPEPLAEHRQRLKMIALVHHPLALETGLDPQTRAQLFSSEKRALQQVHGVIATSEHTVRQLKDYEVEPGNIRVIEPGVPPVPPAPAGSRHRSYGSGGSSGGPVRILCVGTLCARKAQHHLVEALKQLEHPGWHCTLAGSPDRQPEYSARLRSMLAETGLAERIILSGELDQDALNQAWREADLFVLPSLYEGYGMVIDEALAQGLPVVSSDGGALADTARRAGVELYPAGDVLQLRDILAALLKTPERLARLREQALATAANLRSWSMAGKDFQAAVHSLRESLADSRSDPSRFEENWLTLREPADHRSRNAELTAMAARWLQGRSSPQVVDLGAGSGSNFRYLGPGLPGDARWLLVDQDADLLAICGQQLSDVPSGGSVSCLQSRLSSEGFARHLPPEPDLVVASALIDLVTPAWLQALCDYVAKAQSGLLVTLSYAGEFRLSPPHPDDQWIVGLINSHQQGNKGEGAALGPAAPLELESRMTASGYQVKLASSDWHLDAEDCKLQLALLEGWQQAAVEQRPDQKVRVDQWAARHRHAAESGELAIRVKHLDLLALPVLASGA
ncbi:glycosyltransferase [Marinobacter sp.]|uniref:glycosyltransferase n=1 Tax=Marinobacter sp. TaxID=50741 RepID=UPI00385139EA